MTPFIKITRFPYEEPYHINLLIEASNGRLNGQLEFYTNPESLIEAADELEVFPTAIPSEFLWKLGSEKPEDRFAFYFCFRLFTTDLAGHCAIQLRFNNNQTLPDREISDFCLVAEPNALLRLGKLLRQFAKLEDEVLFWSHTEGELFRLLEDDQ